MTAIFFNEGLYYTLILKFDPQSNLPSHHCFTSSKTPSRTETGKRVDVDYKIPLKISPLLSFSSSGQSIALAHPCRLGGYRGTKLNACAANSQPRYQSRSSPRHIALFTCIGGERENIFSSGVEREAFLFVSVYSKSTSSFQSKMMDVLNL